jgi:AcrR family transcriptional regulator
LNAVTARNVAEKMGSSVGPIYSHFENIEELRNAALEEARKLMDEYSRRRWSDIPFLNMGVGFVCFARDEPVLFDVCCREGPSEILSDTLDPITVGRMREDEMLKDFTDEELNSIFLKMSIFAYGMAALSRQGALGDNRTETIIDLLRETGGDVIFMTKARSLLVKPGTTDEMLRELWRYIDD